jgi:Integrase core domain
VEHRPSMGIQAFRGTLGAKVHICRPADPESKGMIERANGYFETSFLPGRTFESPEDFNTQLVDWLAKANTRRMRVLGCSPADRVEADRAAMLSLPPVAPVTGCQRCDRRDRLPDPSVASTHLAPIGDQAGRTGPNRVLDL